MFAMTIKAENYQAFFVWGNNSIQELLGLDATSINGDGGRSSSHFRDALQRFAVRVQCRAVSAAAVVGVVSEVKNYLPQQVSNPCLLGASQLPIGRRQLREYATVVIRLFGIAFENPLCFNVENRERWVGA